MRFHSMQRNGSSFPAGGVGGVVTGVVTDINDPDKKGRVKVTIPRFSDTEESNWARVVTFMAGNDRGAVFLPEVGDEVLLAFELGDPGTPYIIGALHNGQDTAPYDNGDGSNNIRTIKSRSGHIIRFDDTDGAEKIEIMDKNEENLITIDSASESITLESKTKIELKSPDGEIILDAKEITINTSENLTVEAGGDVGVEASGNMDLQGSEINLN